MRYLNVPNSDLRLVDGNVVKLERFEGINWILHDGWFNYEDRRYQGWYFVSIPDQTILPLSDQDLYGIVLVSSKTNEIDPNFIDYDCPHHKPHHHDHPGGLYPPVCPDPEPRRQAFFSEALKKQLEEAFISVPTIKHLKELSRKSRLRDGKIVRVNNTDGNKPKYFIWSASLERWLAFEDFISDEYLNEVLSNYYDKDEMDIKLDEAKLRWERIG